MYGKIQQHLQNELKTIEPEKLDSVLFQLKYLRTLNMIFLAKITNGNEAILFKLMDEAAFVDVVINQYFGFSGL